MGKIVQDQEFPILTRSRKVSPEVLRILQSLDTWAPKQTRATTEILTQLEEHELRSLPSVVERAFGKDHPEVAKMLHRLAVLYHSQGKLEEAEPVYRRALDSAEKAFSEPAEELGLVMNNFGRLLHEKGSLADAESLFRQSLGVLVDALGPGHPKLGTPLSNLARLHMAQGKKESAEKLLQDALAILESAYGPGHRKVAKAKKMLAGVMREGAGQ